MILIAMGVSGAGKSRIGEMIAMRLSCTFMDGDDFHSAANKDKMHRGIPLTDDDRWPWLAAIRAAADAKRAEGESAVFSCSSLKRKYRDVLRGDHDDVRFVYLKGSFEMLRKRLAARPDHFFDPSLLQNQLDTLEEPTEDEGVIEVDIGMPPEEIVELVIRRLGL